MPDTTYELSYWRLAMAEPFRLLFPLGALMGCVGVLLWPLYHFDYLGFYPSVVHERIMIECFLSCFVLGFLGTALPRVLDVPRLTPWETPAFALLLCVVCGLHLGQHTLWGDVAFVMTMCIFIGALVMRAMIRKDLPPPGFILVPMGLSCGIVGAFILASSALITPDPFLFRLAKLLLTQAYLLLPVMGIGAFLLPRFFGMPSQHDFPETSGLPPGWIPRALFSAFSGIVVLLGCALEAADHERIGMLVRAGMVIFYFVLEFNPLRHLRAPGSLALALRLSLLCFPAGLIMAAIASQRVGMLHIFFIGGFGLLTLTVATRVVLGHTGHADRFGARSKVILTIIILTVLAIANRVSADAIPSIRLSHYDYAATCWVIVCIVWLIAYGRLLKQTDRTPS